MPPPHRPPPRRTAGRSVVALGVAVLGVVVAAFVATRVLVWTGDDEPPLVTPLASLPEASPLVVTRCLALEPGRRWELAVVDRPNKRRALEVARWTGDEARPPAVGALVASGAELLRLSVLKDAERKDVLFARAPDPERVWLLGLDIEETPRPLWFTPPVVFAGPDTPVDGTPHRTPITTSGRVAIETALFDTELDVDATGVVSVRWTREGDDRARLELAVELEAEATLAGVPVRRTLDDRLEGLLVVERGWVELTDPKRTYVATDG